MDDFALVLYAFIISIIAIVQSVRLMDIKADIKSAEEYYAKGINFLIAAIHRDNNTRLTGDALFCLQLAWRRLTDHDCVAKIETEEVK